MGSRGHGVEVSSDLPSAHSLPFMRGFSYAIKAVVNASMLVKITYFLFNASQIKGKDSVQLNKFFQKITLYRSRRALCR